MTKDTAIIHGWAASRLQGFKVFMCVGEYVYRCVCVCERELVSGCV